jgi:hypothetical protein
MGSNVRCNEVASKQTRCHVLISAATRGTAAPGGRWRIRLGRGRIGMRDLGTPHVGPSDSRVTKNFVGLPAPGAAHEVLLW